MKRKTDGNNFFLTFCFNFYKLKLNLICIYIFKIYNKFSNKLNWKKNKNKSDILCMIVISRFK